MITSRSLSKDSHFSFRGDFFFPSFLCFETVLQVSLLSPPVRQKKTVDYSYVGNTWVRSANVFEALRHYFIFRSSSQFPGGGILLR